MSAYILERNRGDTRVYFTGEIKVEDMSGQETLSLTNAFVFKSRPRAEQMAQALNARLLVYGLEEGIMDTNWKVVEKDAGFSGNGTPLPDYGHTDARVAA